MPRSISAYLGDIIEACEHILDATKDLDIDGYAVNLTVRRAIERDFQIIGEGLIQLRDRAGNVYARFTHGSKIIGFRHILVHQYFDLDHRTVWDTITHDVKPLHELATRLLAEAGGIVDE